VFRMSPPGDVLPGNVQDQLRLTADQKKLVAELQKEVDGKLEKILNADQRKQLTDLRNGAGPMAVDVVGGVGGPDGTWRARSWPRRTGRRRSRRPSGHGQHAAD